MNNYYVYVKNCANFLKDRISRLKDQLNESRKRLESSRIMAITNDIVDVIANGILRCANALTRMIIIAIILNVVASFCPELPEKIPTVYGFFNGSLDIVEFLYKNAIGGLNAIFTGGISGLVEFGNQSINEFGNLLAQAANWFSKIHF